MVRAAAVLEKSELFQRLGLEIEAFGPGSIAVRSTPSILGGRIDVQKLVNDIADEIEEAKEFALTLYGPMLSHLEKQGYGKRP